MTLVLFLRYLTRVGTRLVGAAMLLMTLTGVSSIEALFAPKSDLWERWAANDPSSTAHIDHSTWNRLVGEYTRPAETGLTRFAYAEVTAEDQIALAIYTEILASLSISTYNRAEQFAFWVNLYNALTVQVVLDHYPVASIRDIDISPGLFADGPWDRALVEIEGEEVTLNDIEHRILRPIWRDPRIHYVVNCASVGCPNLPDAALTADNADAALDAAARSYINSPRGVSFSGGELSVSSIYVWFAEDFGGDDAAILKHISRYADTDLAANLTGRAVIDDHAYDWALNDAVRGTVFDG